MLLLFAVGVLSLVSGCNSTPQSPQAIPSFEVKYSRNDETIPQLPYEIDPDLAEEANLSPPQLVAKYGYDAEVHYVTTEDGYILELHRISGGKKFPTRRGKKVVLLQHGMFLSSAEWVISRPNNGLGYLMADNDYDVWMGNDRGNIYSRNHTKYDPFGSASDRRHYWSFSWHEMGIYDLPAMIDYILNVTGEDKLQYVGYSEGTTIFFVMCSEKSEYNSKIEISHQFAPGVFMSHMRNPFFRVFGPHVRKIEKLSQMLGIHEVPPLTDAVKSFAQRICRDEAITQVICENIISSYFGNSHYLNATLLPIILSHIPAGASIYQFLHYIQLINSGHFQQYDHGLIGNILRYGYPTPPDYNLNNCHVPTAIYYSINDIFSNRTDVELLIDTLPNVICAHLITDEYFTHLDFQFGIQTPELLFKPLFNVMNSTESCSNESA